MAGFGFSVGDFITIGVLAGQVKLQEGSECDL
jgi:hypothetical protein